MEVLNLRAATKAIKATASECGVSETEVRALMQEALDFIWAQDDATPKKQKLLDLFPNGKPCLEHFILALAESLGP